MFVRRDVFIPLYFLLHAIFVLDELFFKVFLFQSLIEFLEGLYTPLLPITEKFRFNNQDCFEIFKIQSDRRWFSHTPLLTVSRKKSVLHEPSLKNLRFQSLTKIREMKRVFIPLYFLLHINFDLTTKIASKF